MKTAISIPDPLFAEAEELARKLKISRSELFARAAANFVKAHTEADVTARLNQVYGAEQSRPDPVLARIQASSIPREEW
jgi:metal-responsive CopG/Arc/MetJ family transcriptional regulator